MNSYIYQLNNTTILLLLSVFLSWSCSKTTSEEQVHVKERPNIVFVMTDDHAFQAISAYDTTLMKTPNIDRIAANGMRFDKAYVTNSICAPSRAVLLTGLFSHLNGVRDNVDTFNSSQETFPKILQRHGYQTAIVGKWHLKARPTGFDYWNVLPDQGQYYHPEFRTPDGVVKRTGYVSDVVTDLAIGFIDSVRNEDQPFMLMYHHKAPHREWWPALEDIKEFTSREIPVPESFFDDYEGRGRAAKETEMRIADHMGWSSDHKIHPEIVEEKGYKEFMKWYKRVYLEQYARLTDEEREEWDSVYGPINEDFNKTKREGKELALWRYKRYMEDYLGSIRSVDRNLGRFMKYLKKSGLEENTLVIYTSDQGFYLGEHGWFDKRFMYEESFRTPLVAQWPGHIKPGSVNNDLVQNIDFAPTLLDVAGAPIPEYMQGKSLLPILKGESPGGWRDALYYHYYEYPGFHMVKRHYGVRTDRYKLIHFYDDIDEWELYDLQEDPHEMNSVYGDEEYADIQVELLKKLKGLRAQYKDDTGPGI